VYIRRKASGVGILVRRQHAPVALTNGAGSKCIRSPWRYSKSWLLDILIVSHGLLENIVLTWYGFLQHMPSCFPQGCPSGICGARSNDIVWGIQANSEKGLKKSDGGFFCVVTFVLLIYLVINTCHWKNITFRDVTPCSPVNALTRNGTGIKTGLEIGRQDIRIRSPRYYSLSRRVQTESVAHQPSMRWLIGAL